MPIYTYRNVETNEIFDVMMSISDLQEYSKQHPSHERYYDSVPAIVSGVSTSTKTDDGFKEVLSRIAEAHPESTLADQHGRKSIKQVQTERAIRKWRSAQ